MGFFDFLKSAPKISCEQCGISKKEIDRKNEAVAARAKAMGAGMFINLSEGGLLKCPKCGKIACTKCGVDLPGHDIKSCPFCKASYNFDSVLD